MKMTRKEFTEAYTKLVELEPTSVGGFYYDYSKRQNTKFPIVKFPRGHITFLMLDALTQNAKGMRRKDLIEYAFVKLHGQEMYDWKNTGEGRNPKEKHGMRGYWTGNFLAPGQYANGGAIMYRLCNRTEDGKYIINDAGRAYLVAYVLKQNNKL